MKQALRAVIYKDMKEVIASKQTLLPMIIVPMAMMVFLPVVLMIVAKYGASSFNGMDSLIERFAGRLSYENNSQLIVAFSTNYIFPALFILIPVLTSSIIAASSFVGEKERKTLETLLYTPISIRELFTAKVIGSTIPAYVVAVLSAVLFGVIANVGGWFYFRRLIFPSLNWIMLIFWVTPAVTVFGVSFMVIVSAKAHTFQDAQQMSALVVLPVVLLIIGQLTGVFMLNWTILLLLGAVLYLADYILLKHGARKFTAEKMV